VIAVNLSCIQCYLFYSYSSIPLLLVILFLEKGDANDPSPYR